MITQELLEEAKRRFPMGTKYIHPADLNDLDPPFYTIYGNDFKEWSLKEDSIQEINSNGLVYSQGKWGKIITEEYIPIIFN